MEYTALAGDGMRGQQRLTANLAIISRKLLKLINDQVRVFRKTLDGRYIIKSVPSSELTAEEICLINRLCDRQEQGRNADVKRIVTSTIRSAMSGEAFQLVEFGGGYNPLKADYGIDQYQIEIDPNVIRAQMEEGLKSSTFEGMKEGSLKTDRPRVVPAVFCFHFMKPQHVLQIGHVVTKDGFFIANCMNARHYTARQSMVNAFGKAAFQVGVVRMNHKKTKKAYEDESKKAKTLSGFQRIDSMANIIEHRASRPLGNEFWIAAKDEEVFARGMNCLQGSISRIRPSIEVWEQQRLN